MAAPSHAAARLLGLRARTLHKRAEAFLELDWTVGGAQPEGTSLELLRERLQGVRVCVFDEASMIVPEVFNGSALRHTYAVAGAESLDVSRYIEESFANVPIVILLGDFMQLRPLQS